MGCFRNDLYYRLNVFRIRVPPLRERVEDIPLLAEHFVRKFSDGFRKPVRGIANDALRLLMGYSYPGNIRELENEIVRAVALCEPEGLIEASLLSEKFLPPDSPLTRSSPSPLSGRLQDTVKAFERETIGQALRRSTDNKASVARELKISYRGLLKKLQVR